MNGKILTVVGARPQIIKASVVSQALRDGGGMDEVLVHTGQHFDANMSDVFFEELGMSPPAHHLGIAGGGHGEMTGRMLIEIERVIRLERPDAVLVYGDTNSTLAGALAAAKLHVPVAHVEAGLRSFNMKMPEEVNRILTDRMSTWLFAPTEDAVKHLVNEGMPQEKIHLVGDVMYDVAIHHGRRAEEFRRRGLARMALEPRGYVLVTVHRAENTDAPDRLLAIVDGLRKVANSIPVVWPLHPRTRAVLQSMGLLEQLSKVATVIEPQGYLDMVMLERSAAVIATDSGGVQKEAFFHEVPCVTLRDETEWVELVSSGWNRLVTPTDGDAIHSSIMAAIGSRGAEVKPYGTGSAAQSVVRMLKEECQDVGRMP